MTLSLSRMASAENSLNDSAQSPACSRKARPAATSASAWVSWRASPANTSGGSVESCFRARSRAAWSGHSGCWSAGRSRQLLGLHSDIRTRVTAQARPPAADRYVYWSHAQATGALGSCALPSDGTAARQGESEHGARGVDSSAVPPVGGWLGQGHGDGAGGAFRHQAGARRGGRATGHQDRAQGGGGRAEDRDGQPGVEI